MRKLMLPLACAMALALSGCISSTSVMKIKPDGSGTIEETTTMGAEFALQMKQMLKGMNPDGGEVDLFKVSDAKAKAARMGEGVTFVKAEKVKTAEGEGLKSIYAFKDVTKLKMSQKPQGPKAPGQAPKKEEAPITFAMSKKGGNSVLTITFPKPKGGEKSDKGDGAPPNMPEPPPQQMEQMKKIFKGMKVGLHVEVDGKLVKTNSPYVEGNRVTLMEIDFGKLLSDQGKLKEVIGLGKNPSMEQVKSVIKDMKGMKVNIEPVTIEFAGK